MTESPISVSEPKDELLKWRGDFPILDRSTYLISNSLGAMPRGVYSGLHSYADMWATRGVKAWEEGWVVPQPPKVRTGDQSGMAGGGAASSRRAKSAAA